MQFMLYLHFSHWLNIAPQGIISLHFLLVIVSLGSSGQWHSNTALYLGPEVMSKARAVFSHNPEISWQKQSIRRQKREVGIRVQPRESSGHRLEHRTVDPGAGQVAAAHQTGCRRCGASAQICYPPAAWEATARPQPSRAGSTLHAADGYSPNLVWDEMRRTVFHLAEA